jgi:hypothetical protein|tara:strand:+ start:298 stop:459 length:162 start_codon:yes stop_codon:yes gene_type:complete
MIKTQDKVKLASGEVAVVEIVETRLRKDGNEVFLGVRSGKTRLIVNANSVKIA